MKNANAKARGPVPPLRFPEFRDAGPWEAKRLGEIGAIVKGKGISKSDIKPDGTFPCIRYGELYTIYGEVIREVASFTDVDPGNLVLSDENDVILPASGETKEDIATASCVTLKGVALGSDLNIFRSPLNGAFLAYYVRGNLKSEISKVAQGDSVVHLYPTQLEKLQLAVPSNNNEQQKIAACLGSLDDLIRAEEGRLAALKVHKRGLMQRLFPAPGQTTPHLRFPEFCDAGPWEAKRLDALVNTITPPNKIQTSGYLPSGRFPIIDQSPNGICGWTDDETALVDADFPLVVFGDHSCAVKIAEGPFAQGADGIKILAPVADIAARFLYLYLQADPIKQRSYRRHFSTLKEKLILFPARETGEQQMIADCLGSLDDLIRAEEGRLAALKAHKHGLMQRLFPREVG